MSRRSTVLVVVFVVAQVPQLTLTRTKKENFMTNSQERGLTRHHHRGRHLRHLPVDFPVIREGRKATLSSDYH